MAPRASRTTPSQTPTLSGAVIEIAGATGCSGFWASAYWAALVSVAPSRSFFSTPPLSLALLRVVAST